MSYPHPHPHPARRWHCFYVSLSDSCVNGVSLSQAAGDIEHLCLWVLAICVSLVSCQLVSPVHFLVELGVFLLLDLRVLYVL